MRVCVCERPTLAEWFGSIPGAVLGAHQRGGAVGIHVEPRGTLVAHRVVVDEVPAHSHAIGWHARVATVDH